MHTYPFPESCRTWRWTFPTLAYHMVIFQKSQIKPLIQMAWLFISPGHKQAWYWLCWFLILWIEDFSYLHWSAQRECSCTRIYFSFSSKQFQINKNQYIIVAWIILMAKCKTVESPLLTHWRYCSFALNHRYQVQVSCTVSIFSQSSSALVMDDIL